MDHPGEVIKKWRKEKKKSITTIARISNIDKGTISRFERGGDFKMRVFRDLCKALNRSPAQAYAELSICTGPAPTQVENTLCATNPEHRMYQIKLDEIFHKDAQKGEWIKGNVITFYERLFGPSPDLTPKLDHGPLRDITAPSPGQIIERKGKSQKKRFGN